jgi:hypothetical protein
MNNVNRLAFALTVVMSSAPGCAEISDYEVQPARVCPGETVSIRWKANAGVTLTAEPPIAGLGARPAEGTATVTVDRSTRLTLVAERLFKNAQREWDVVVAPGAPPKPFGGLAACNEAERAVVVSFNLAASAVSPAARPVRLINPYDRRLVVAKDGVVETIPPRGASERFKDLPAQGAWTIRAPLDTGEACDGVLTGVSDRLVITVQMSCGA